jgi:hypothetical protein
MATLPIRNPPFQDYRFIYITEHGPLERAPQKEDAETSDLVAPIGLDSDGTGAEEGVSIAHLVDTLHLGRGSHGEDRVVHELHDLAPTTLFAGQTGTSLVAFRLFLFDDLLYVSFYHGTTPPGETRETCLFLSDNRGIS